MPSSPLLELMRPAFSTIAASSQTPCLPAIFVFGLLALGCSPSAKAESDVEIRPETRSDVGLRGASTHAAATTTASKEEARFNGTFVHCKATRDHDLAALRSTLDAAVAVVNDAIRGLVRNKLRVLEEHPRLADAFTLSVTSRSIRMSVDSRDGSEHYRVTAPADGTTKHVKDWDGEDMTVEFRIVDGRMHQTFSTSSGKRENVSFIDNNGNLTLDVKVTPRRFLRGIKNPSDIEYRLHYCRTPEGGTES